MSTIKIFPIFPIYYEGKTGFNLILIVWNNWKYYSEKFKKISIECIGPEK